MSTALERWSPIVADLERSGERVADCAARYGVNPRTLAWWRSEIRRRRRESGAFVPVVVKDVRSATLSVRISRVGAEIEVDDDFDPRLLRRVVEALC